MTRLPAAAVLALGLSLCFPALAGTAKVLEDERLAEVKTDLEGLFERIDEAGLPATMFEAKVREGLVKKVPPAKILGALGKMEKTCLDARKLLVASGLKATPSLIGSVFQALQAGVSKDDAARLLEGLVESKASQDLVGKSLLVVVMMRESGTAGTEAVSKTLAIVDADGKSGLDAWLKKNSKSTKKGGSKSQDKKAKGKPGKKKHKAKGKSPGKSHGK
jgi:hypothetical protein